jgi:phosphatidylglycerophosphate synthase
MSHHTWAHRIVRPLVRPLLGTAVTPNHLTALRLLTGAAAAALLAGGDALSADIAGLLFLISFLLDRADGELARQSGRVSASGHRLDLYADFTANILVFLGMGVGLQQGALGEAAIFLGVAAGAAIGAIFLVVNRVEQQGGNAGFPTAKGFDPDDGMIFIPLAIWFGAAAYVLVAAALGAPAFLAWTLWRFRHSLRHVPGPLHNDRVLRRSPAVDH